MNFDCEFIKKNKNITDLVEMWIVSVEVYGNSIHGISVMI